MTPSFIPGMLDYDPKRHNLIEAVSKCMITRQEAQAKFNECHETQGSHDEVYTDGSKRNERVGAAAAINRHFQSGETNHLHKRLPDNGTIFATGATAITLVLNYYRYMGPVHHNVVVYSDSIFIFIKTYLTRMTRQPKVVLLEVLPYTTIPFIYMITKTSTWI